MGGGAEFCKGALRIFFFLKNFAADFSFKNFKDNIFFKIQFSILVLFPFVYQCLYAGDAIGRIVLLEFSALAILV